MVTFVPVTDTERAKSEQNLNDSEFAAHRQFDAPHAVGRGKGKTDRGWAQGELGWGVLKSFGDDDRDDAAQVAKHADGAHKMVKNEKGLWVKVKTVEEDGDSKQQSSGMGRGKGISVLDKFVQDNKPLEDRKSPSRYDSRQFEDAKDDKYDYRKPNSNRKRDRSNSPTTRQDKYSDKRSDRRSVNSREDKRNQPSRGRSRESDDRRSRHNTDNNSRNRDTIDRNKRDDSRNRSRVDDRKYEDREKDSKYKGKEDRDQRRRSRSRSRSISVHHSPSYSRSHSRSHSRSRSRSCSEDSDTKHHHKKHKKHHKEKKEKKEKDKKHNKKEKKHSKKHHHHRRSSSSSSRSPSCSRSHSPEVVEDNKPSEPQEQLAVKEEEEQPMVMTAIQIINHFHDIFSTLSLTITQREGMLEKLFHPAAEIMQLTPSAVPVAKKIYISGKTDILHAYQKVTSQPVIVSKRIYITAPSPDNNDNESSNKSTWCVDYHRANTSPALGDNDDCHILLYECVQDQIRNLWGCVDQLQLSENTELTLSDILQTAVWKGIEQIVQTQWQVVSSLSSSSSSLLPYVHYHNYDHMEVWG